LSKADSAVHAVDVRTQDQQPIEEFILVNSDKSLVNAGGGGAHVFAISVHCRRAFEFIGHGSNLRRAAAFFSKPGRHCARDCFGDVHRFSRAKYGSRGLLLIPASWFGGCLFGTLLIRPSTWPVTAISFLVLGGIVAANAQLSLNVTSGLAILLGLMHGCMNGAGMRWTASVVVAYIGLVAGIFVVVAQVSALVIRLRPPWAPIMVRVAENWVIASGLLLLGWAAQPS
jgi:HupE / UreJ protein